MNTETYKLMAKSKKTNMTIRITSDSGKSSLSLQEAHDMMRDLCETKHDYIWGNGKFFTYSIVEETV
tara:strand:- start:163 stop:363 length:201 start_codon:yes stop_codon:yes gene_type:complete